jgi:hypothetical protein
MHKTVDFALPFVMARYLSNTSLFVVSLILIDNANLKEIYTLYYIQEAKKKVTFVPTLIFCAYPKGFFYHIYLIKHY